MERQIIEIFKRRTTLRQVEVLVTLRRTGSITKTANALSKSAANVSLSCRRFEANVEVQVFEKTRKGVILTPLGEFLIGELEEIARSITVFSKRAEASETLVRDPTVA